MDPEARNTEYDPLFVRNMIESFLRISLLVILILLAYDIIKPFTTPILWGAIIAIAAFPLVKWLQPKIGDRRGLACTIVCLVFITILIVPTWSVTEASLKGLKNLSVALENDTLDVPPPNDSVRDWPLLGERIYRSWSQASVDLGQFLSTRSEQVRDLAGALVKRVGNSLLGVLMFVISVVIAGGFMAYAEACGAAAHRFFVRVGGL